MRKMRGSKLLCSHRKKALAKASAFLTKSADGGRNPSGVDEIASLHRAKLPLHTSVASASYRRKPMLHSKLSPSALAKHLKLYYNEIRKAVVL